MKTGSAGPLLHRTPEAPAVDSGSIMALVHLLVDVEKRLTNGPWDDWDAVVLMQWKEIVKRRLRQALVEIDEAQRDPSRADYEIVGEDAQ